MKNNLKKKENKCSFTKAKVNFAIIVLVLSLPVVGISQMQFDGGVMIGWTNNKRVNFAQSLYNPPNYNNLDTVFSSYNASKGGWGIILFPKYQFGNVAGHGLNLGIPFHIGFGGNDDDVPPIYMDANITLDFTGGRLNKRKDNTDRTFGYYVGGGFGFVNSNGFSLRTPLSKTKVNPNLTDQILVPPGGKVRDFISFNAFSMHAIIHAGLVVPFHFSKKFLKDHSMGLGFFYKPPFRKEDFSFWGVHAMYAIGSKSKE